MIGSFFFRTSVANSEDDLCLFQVQLHECRRQLILFRGTLAPNQTDESEVGKQNNLHLKINIGQIMIFTY